MGSRRPSPPNITFPPRPQPPGGNRPQPPRPQPPIPQPPRPTPQPPRPEPPRPQPPRPTPPTTPSGPVTPPTGITSPPQIDRRPQPPRPQPPRPMPGFVPTRPFDPAPQPGGGTRPMPPGFERHRDTIKPPKPQPPRPDMPGFVPPRRFPDGRPDRTTGFFGPRKDYGRGSHSPSPDGRPIRRGTDPSPTPEERRRRRRMAGERPMVVERVTTEAPRRPRFREDDTISRDFEGFRQRRPKRDVNIAQQDI